MPKIDAAEATLSDLHNIWTAQEIAQQPEMLRRTHDILMEQSAALSEFLAPFADARARIILTGAGTSSFIGECLAPYLSGRLAARVDAIATTDIVSAPHLYLEADTPTLLVSFGRSGSSPESMAAVDLANAIVADVRHLIITCNDKGALALNARLRDYVIQLPEAVHDRGFAMTSSFSCMMYAALAVFSGVETMAGRIDAISSAVSEAIDSSGPVVTALVAGDYDRVVYLGSHVFKGLAREAALKLMELSDGQIVAIAETPLGFRHGPKTIVTENTLIVVFLSNNLQARAYDIDLLNELRADGKAARIVAVSTGDGGNGDCFNVSGLGGAQDVDLLFPFIVMPQIFALYSSIALGLTPDSPNAAGIVNRVVQGVTIYPLVAA